MSVDSGGSARSKASAAAFFPASLSPVRLGQQRVLRAAVHEEVDGSTAIGWPGDDAVDMSETHAQSDALTNSL